MASPQGSQSFTARNSVQMWDHDPDGTCAVAVTPDAGTTERWVDMRDYEEFVVAAMSSALTGNGISLLEIVASDASDGSTNVTQIKTSGAIVADAVGDWAIESCTRDEIIQEGEDISTAGVKLRYVTARITVANSADEAVVVFIRKALRSSLNLTPVSTIA